MEPLLAAAATTIGGRWGDTFRACDVVLHHFTHTLGSMLGIIDLGGT